MVITDIRLQRLRTDTDSVIVGTRASLYQNVPQLFLMRIMTDEGVEGNYISYHIAPEHIDRTLPILKKLLIGASPFYRQQYSARMLACVPVFADSPVFAAADICLWDIGAKHARLPLRHYIGASRDSLPAYASLTRYDSVEAYLDVCARCVADGFRAIKLHPFGQPGPDIALCQAVRSAHPGIELMLDPVGAYTVAEALKVGRALEKLDFVWLEHPINEYDIDGYVYLRGKLDVPLAAAEQAFPGFPMMHNYLSRGAADYYRSLADYRGGITEMLKAMRLCEAYGVCYEGHSYGSAQAMAMYLQVGCCCDNWRYLEMLYPTNLLGQGLRAGLPLTPRGDVAAPDRPGIGVELDWEAIDNLTIARY